MLMSTMCPRLCSPSHPGSVSSVMIKFMKNQGIHFHDRHLYQADLWPVTFIIEGFFLAACDLLPSENISSCHCVSLPGKIFMFFGKYQFCLFRMDALIDRRLAALVDLTLAI